MKENMQTEKKFVFAWKILWNEKLWFKKFSGTF